VFKQYQNPIIATQPFPNGFNTYEYVLVVAGPGGEQPTDTPVAPTPSDPSVPADFTPYIEVRPYRDESAGDCTQYVAYRTQEAFGVSCVTRYGNACDWLDPTKTTLNDGWTSITTNDVTQIRAGDVIVFDETGNQYGHVLFVESTPSGIGSRIIILTQSNVRNPGGQYGNLWRELIHNRKYRFSCTNIEEANIQNYLGNHMLGIIRYTG